MGVNDDTGKDTLAATTTEPIVANYSNSSQLVHTDCHSNVSGSNINVPESENMSYVSTTRIRKYSAADKTEDSEATKEPKHEIEFFDETLQGTCFGLMPALEKGLIWHTNGLSSNSQGTALDVSGTVLMQTNLADNV